MIAGLFYLVMAPYHQAGRRQTGDGVSSPVVTGPIIISIGLIRAQHHRGRIQLLSGRWARAAHHHCGEHLGQGHG